MPPMCTPEKNKVEDSQTRTAIEELYFNPRDESITDCSGSDDDEEAKIRMDKLALDFPALDKLFDVHGQVGEGTFSTVYVAVLKGNRNPDRRFAVKHIVPTCHPDRIKFELECLKRIGGRDNVVGIDLCLRNNNNVLFIMPYQPHNTFSEYVGNMDVTETAQYMKNLLIALARVHEFNIIHRDVKPSNFLYDRATKRYLLVDFGLAQKQPELNQNSPKVQPIRYVEYGKKRKRDPLSPINGLTQDPKRAFRAQLANVLKTPQPVKPSRTTTRISSQKENVPSDRSGKNVVYVKLETLPEARTAGGPKGCSCYGKPRICSMCPLDKAMQASRAGTPGFRPPEVLLKYPHQTTAVDIWAAGIIMLSILSNCTNFFSCPNDLAALLELVTIFGHDDIKKAANRFGRYFICSDKKPALDLKKICCTVRSRGNRMVQLMQGDKCINCRQYTNVCLCPGVPLSMDIEDVFPESAYDLLKKLLDLNPKTRITAADALKHTFLN